ncbi:hypothetical protein GCM10023114_55420 [Mycolicibacterium sediminis]|uniref:Uncharacterized protein n=1 Tax=Mycolicibacterium sediminis TaxID=1286180 RepID=A0A7I7QN84_9MYCO|nr:hypothetical protein MSEDJ_19550 [Mycolicibacterium sediminis]
MAERQDTSPTLDAASPAKPGCWALQKPAPEDSYLVEGHSRARGGAGPMLPIDRDFRVARVAFRVSFEHPRWTLSGLPPTWHGAASLRA